MVLVGWAYTAAQGPGVAPLTVTGAAEQPVPPTAGCLSTPCPDPAPSSIGVATDGADTLVLLGRPTSAESTASLPAPTLAAPPAGGQAPTGLPPLTTPATVPSAGGVSPTGAPRVVVTFQDSPRPLVLEASGTGQTWRIDAAGRRWTTIVKRVGLLDVVRLPGAAPSARWSATVDAVPVPAQGFAPVTHLSRPRDALASHPAQSLAGAVLIAVVIALHGHHSASRHALRSVLRSIGFGLVTVYGAPALVAQLHTHAPAAPNLLTIATILAPLPALAIAAGTARLLTASVPTSGAASRGLRLVTACTAVLLTALLGYVGELASSGLFSGSG